MVGNEGTFQYSRVLPGSVHVPSIGHDKKSAIQGHDIRGSSNGLISCSVPKEIVVSRLTALANEAIPSASSVL